MASKSLITKGELICPRGSATYDQLCNNIGLILKVKESFTETTIELTNVYGQNHTFTQPKGISLHQGWFRVLHPGKTLAAYEMAVVAYILQNPGCAIHEISLMVPNREGVNGVKSAITRISKKGFTMLHNFVQGW